MTERSGEKTFNRAGGEFHAADKILVVGLDGATWDVLGPLMAEGRMPRLAAAIAGGASGPLRSTSPAITPAAWTTFLTGLEPGEHGIIDFESYDSRTGELRFNTSRRLPGVRDIWDILGGKGLKVGSINVPLTFPAKPVSGFLISGFETPGPDSDFVYPRDLKHEILSQWPDPTLRAHWKSSLLNPGRAFRENLDYVCRSFHQGAEMTERLGEKFGWDVLMVVLKLVDNLEHKTWKYLDPRWPDRSPARREACRRCFEELDLVIGRFLDYAAAHRAAVMMVSDHGHGSLEGKAQPNYLLKKWGYLVFGGLGNRSTRGVDGTSTNGRVSKNGIQKYLPVDLTRTRACVMHADNNGFVYINLKGRQPTGIVDPSDYEPLRNELLGRFRGEECRVRAPGGETIELFSQVDKPEELYGIRREDYPWLPDLMLTPHETMSVVRRIRGNKPARWLSYRQMEGTHRRDGIFVAFGPGISRGVRTHPRIHDCAPTILAMMGVPIPKEMRGRVIGEIFDRPLQAERSGEERAASAPREPRAELNPGAPGARAESPIVGSPQAEQSAYSERDLQEVTERLSQLGYLE